MFQPVYILWSLLPLTFFLLTGWVRLRPILGMHGKESSGEYFRQFLFTLLALVVAIMLDQRLMDEALGFISLTDTEGEKLVVHWLLYPFTLTVFAYINRTFNRMRGTESDPDLTAGLARYRR